MKDQINWYDKKSIEKQRVYRRIQLGVIVLSAITPVLVMLVPDATRWPAVAMSALVAIGTTTLKTFKYEEDRINYRTTWETLRKEIHFYTAGVSDYRDTDDRQSLFVERVESLISRENTMWLATQRPKARKDESES
jgi:hypothetical protein